MMASSVTLRDVAKLAGVSVGTASQALNNRPHVAPETRARVLDAARSLGYPIKDLPYGADSVKVVGLLTKHDLGLPVEVNPFYSYIQAGVESECRKQRISLMYANVEVDPSNHPVQWPPMIREQHVDGLILAGTFIEETADLFQRQIDVPIVLVDSYAPSLPFDGVVIDNTPAARGGVEYLIERGHTRIGLVGWNDESPPSVQERQIGYCQALQRHNIERTFIEPSGLNRESGHDAIVRLLGRHPEVTAVFACNDVAALGVLSGARDLGMNVPGDLSVLGFDNIDMAQETVPSLTTVHVYKTWMGVLGVRRLLERARDPAQPKVTMTLDTQLVVRDSVASFTDSNTTC
jgi:LacI family transcriptional regulator